MYNKTFIFLYALYTSADQLTSSLCFSDELESVENRFGMSKLLETSPKAGTLEKRMKMATMHAQNVCNSYTTYMYTHSTMVYATILYIVVMYVIHTLHILIV